jgi:MFS family permease
MVLSTMFAGPLSDKLPPQAMVGFGALSMAGAMLSASFVNQLWQLYLCSTLYGIGGSFCYTPAPAMISIWFKKRRSLAMGVFVSGSGIGSFICAAVVQACISARGWRFALQILAAMCAGWMFPCAFLFKRKTKPTPRSGALITFVWFKNKTFTLVFMSVLFIFFGFFMPQGRIREHWRLCDFIIHSPMPPSSPIITSYRTPDS